MEIYNDPDKTLWQGLCERARSTESAQIDETVSAIISRVRKDGDKALYELAREIDGVSLDELRVSRKEFAEAEASVSDELKSAIDTAIAAIRAFHEAQLPREVSVETFPGVRCVQRPVPIQNVGLYIPGGTAPLFSTVLMLAIPAKVARCSRIVLCTPTDRNGKVSREVLFAAARCGVTEVFKAGGAQAIAAMAYGTGSIPRVDKIFGPGNRYVMSAKLAVSRDCCSIDMPAGPSEVMVIADKSADARFVASDLLSQAEHGRDSQVILVCHDASFAASVNAEIDRQSESLSRGSFIKCSLRESRTIVLRSRLAMTEFANQYAPEHLVLSVENPWEMASGITAAGSVFIGNWSPESAGDYASGTNHTLPTSAWARSCSGVNVDSYMRKMTLQELTREGLEGLSSTIVTMAGAEGLDAHANAVKVRMEGGR